VSVALFENHSDLILRSVAKQRVSKDGGRLGACGHPSRRSQVLAPQDEVLSLFHPQYVGPSDKLGARTQVLETKEGATTWIKPGIGG
jgi:hypothetical protein